MNTITSLIMDVINVLAEWRALYAKGQREAQTRNYKTLPTISVLQSTIEKRTIALRYIPITTPERNIGVIDSFKLAMYF